MNANRLIALKLAGLTKRDREWILGQIPRGVAKAVRETLRELGSFEHGGLWQEMAGKFSDLASGAGFRVPKDVHQSSEENILRIDHAPPDDVKQVLEGCPSILLAIILQLWDWRWRPAVIGGASPELRASLLRAKPGTMNRLAPKARDALLAALAATLNELVDLRKGTNSGQSFEAFLSSAPGTGAFPGNVASSANSAN